MILFDLFIILFFIFHMYLGSKRGFLNSLWSLLSSFISYFGAYLLYPSLGSFIANSSFFLNLVKGVLVNFVDLDSFLGAASKNMQQEFISSMDLPVFMKTALLENNNPEIYGLFDLSNFKDYILTYISQFVLNIITILILFAFVKLFVKFFSRGINFVSKAPIIKPANKSIGLVFGFFQALLTIWIVFLVMSLFIGKPEFAPLFQALERSFLASFLYKNNLLLLLVLKVMSS